MIRLIFDLLLLYFLLKNVYSIPSSVEYASFSKESKSYGEESFDKTIAVSDNDASQESGQTLSEYSNADQQGNFGLSNISEGF